MTTYSRVTIVPADTFCSVNNVGFSGLDMSSLPASLHAMQWYGTWGEEEYMNLETRQMLPNVRITSLDAYNTVLAEYQVLFDIQQQQQQEQIAEDTIIEV